MNKTRFYPPYLPSGRTRFPQRLKPGVYIIKKAGKFFYIGHSFHDVYRTMYRHFESWHDPKQIRVTFSKNEKDVLVRVIYTATREQAPKLEKALIVKYKPPGNPEKYESHTNTKKDEKLIESSKNAEFLNPTSEEAPF